MESKCNCGGLLTKQNGNFKHTMFDRIITVNNTPHLICGNCKKLTYICDKCVYECLSRAYRGGMVEIQYSGQKMPYNLD